MIVPSDKDYKETKLIKQGKASINPDFKLLADWIGKKYEVAVLNIYFDTIIVAYKKRSRVNIIFEHPEEELKFRDGFLGNFHSDKQEIIAKKFDEFVNGKPRKHSISIWPFRKNKQYGSDTQNLLIIFSSFKQIAREEANEGIPKSEIESLKTAINNPDIWEISRFASSATFFFYSQQQADIAEANGYIQQLSDSYLNVLKKYDEFNYFDRQTFSVRIDSKENFDKNYESSWFNYYR